MTVARAKREVGAGAWPALCSVHLPRDAHRGNEADDGHREHHRILRWEFLREADAELRRVRIRQVGRHDPDGARPQVRARRQGRERKQDVREDHRRDWREPDEQSNLIALRR
jgi:hypothetical protein